MQKNRKTRTFDLATLVALHAGIGSAVGVAIGSILVFLNSGGLRDLIIASGDPIVPLVVLYATLASIYAMIEISLAMFPFANRE
ncbi:MAG: hypothetical protein RIC14_13415 [Filomicrobium sp.]